MIQVIDIRKRDPEKVIEYWKSKGGKDVYYGRHELFPFVGINLYGNIAGWNKLLDYHELIDLPTEQTEPQLIPGKEYTMRNGEKAWYVGRSLKLGLNIFERKQGGLWYYEGLKCEGRGWEDFDIILEPEKKEPRVIHVDGVKFIECFD